MIRAFPRVAALAAVCAVLLPVSPAFAHVTLETRQAPVDGTYKAVLKVPHGCKGSPMVTLRVRIPDGVIGVKPQPKAGWTLDTVKADYARSYALHHGQVTSGVREIAWTGRLPDDRYDEFVFIAYLSDTLKAPGTLYFPVVQECEQGVERWIDRPDANGKASQDRADSPAPSLKLLPKQ